MLWRKWRVKRRLNRIAALQKRVIDSMTSHNRMATLAYAEMTKLLVEVQVLSGAKVGRPETSGTVPPQGPGREILDRAAIERIQQDHCN